MITESLPESSGQAAQIDLSSSSSDEKAPESSADPAGAAAGSETETGSSISEGNPESSSAEEELLDPDGNYTTKEDVALYLYQYGELPQNFMTKKEAKKLGWSGGGLDDYAYGMCIGGDRFGNYEGNLPDGNYRECDIDTLHAKKRGAKRIVFSDDGRIYYTEDHYESFELLYGEE
ncbi:MAG: ribonuclease [Lachnospiraceae bacterium]|nr:ribonuclease [Lachnospiraceae bacterium]